MMKYVQGALIGAVHRPEFPLQIQTVDQQLLDDESGLYNDYFTIVTASGIRIRVILVVEEEEDEWLDS